MGKISLTGLFPEEVSALLPPGKERYRGMQIFRWIHEKEVEAFEEMTNLPKDFRANIADRFVIGTSEIADIAVSSDGPTDKYLWRLGDGEFIESVIIRDEGRVTACISSQAGCKMRCKFCRTGELGFKRQLTAGEILEQVIGMRRMLRRGGKDITNIVFMGMGDPLDNLDEVVRAVRIINMEESLSIGLRKITISTCGIPPGIIRLAGELRRIGLAISLNAPDNALRSKLMPVNKKYPLKSLLDAAREFSRITKRRVTLEYILISGINDTPDHARKLLTLARSLPSKINLIAFNEYEGSPFKRPSDGRIELFQQILFDGNVTAMLRKSKGTDISAACGQLAGKHTSVP